MSGKGDNRRPASISQEQWDKAWERTFNKAGTNSHTRPLNQQDKDSGK